MTAPSEERAPTVTIPLDQWSQMHRDIGMAEGLLSGWLLLDASETANARKATQRFLDRGERKDEQ